MNGSKYWDKRAVKYSELTKTPVFAKEYDRALKLSGIEGKQINCILDICCGDGTLLACAIKRSKVKFAIGVDYSSEMIKLARENLKKAGACVSRKPVDVYNKLAQLTRRAMKGEKVMDEYRRVYDEHLALKQKVKGMPLGVLLKQDMKMISFGVKPVADAVFFVFPVFGSISSTNMPDVRLQSAVKEVLAWSYHLYHFGNALNYLRPGGKLVVLLSITTPKGVERSHKLHKDMFRAMEKLGCTLSKFEVYEDPELAREFMNFYDDKRINLDFIAAVFTRTEDKSNTAAVRKDIVETCRNTFSVLEQTKSKGPIFVTHVRGRVEFTDERGRKFYLDDVITKLSRLAR